MKLVTFILGIFFIIDVSALGKIHNAVPIYTPGMREASRGEVACRPVNKHTNAQHTKTAALIS